MTSVKLNKSRIISTKGISVAAVKPNRVELDKEKLLSTKGLSAAGGKPER